MNSCKLSVLVRLCAVALLGTGHAQAASSYPKFDGPGVDVADADVRSQAIDPLFALLGQHLGSRLEQRNLLTTDDVAKIIQILTDIETRVPARQWPVVTPSGRISLPQIVANNGRGLICGLDAFYGIPLLAQDKQSFLALTQYAWCWQLLFESRPAVAFKLLSSNNSNQQPASTDIVRLYAALGYWPGGKLQGTVDKDAWQKLHQSANPLSRFIALEKFDSVDQSPAELLALYRECLFGACSYLEVRALEAISRNKDFREEVAKLLEEYIASNPPANDGTLPGLRNNFPNLIEGAKRVTAAIRNTDKPTAPTTPQLDPFAQSATESKQPTVVQPPAPKKPETKPAATSDEQPASTPWLVWAVLIVAATGLLWLLLKKRK